MTDYSLDKFEDSKSYTTSFNTLLERIRITVPDVVEYCSTEDFGSDEESDDDNALVDAIDDILSIAPRLMSLEESNMSILESISNPEGKKSFKTPSTPADLPESHFAGNLRDKYPEASDDIIKIFAHAGWTLYQSVRPGMCKREEMVKNVDPSERDSAYQSMLQSQAAPSLLGGLPKPDNEYFDTSSVSTNSTVAPNRQRPLIPKTPVAIGRGIEFNCPVCCHKQTEIDTTRKWMYVIIY